MIYEKNLKQIRCKYNKLQKDMGAILGVSEHTYSHYESGDATIPIKHLITVCKHFNVSLDFLFNFSEYKNCNFSNKEFNLKLSGKRLKEFRKENKLTQGKLAEFLNTTTSVISGYEIGRYLIATPFLYTICKNYNISADYLLGFVDEPKYLK